MSLLVHRLRPQRTTMHALLFFFGVNFALTSQFDKGVDGLLTEHSRCLNAVRQLEPIYHWAEAPSTNGNGRCPAYPSSKMSSEFLSATRC